jgi:hypothetical protein
VTVVCGRCGGTGLDPEHEGECGECSIPCCRDDGQPPEDHSQSCPKFGTRALLEKLRIAECGMAEHAEDRRARDWLARDRDRIERRLALTIRNDAKEVDRLKYVIRTGGAMYRAEEVLAGKSRSYIAAAQALARHLLNRS